MTETKINGSTLPIGIINPALLKKDTSKAEDLSSTPIPFGKGEYLPALVKASEASTVKPEVKVVAETSAQKETVPDEIEIKATKGLWLSKIAMEYDVEAKDAPIGKLSKALAEYNGIKNANNIKLGQTIKIPKTLVVDGKTYTFGKEATEESIKKDIENSRTIISAKKVKSHHKKEELPDKKTEQGRHLIFKQQKFQ